MSSVSESREDAPAPVGFTAADVELVHRAVVALRVCEAAGDLVAGLIAVEGKISAVVTAAVDVPSVSA